MRLMNATDSMMLTIEALGEMCEKKKNAVLWNVMSCGLLVSLYHTTRRSNVKRVFIVTGVRSEVWQIGENVRCPARYCLG